MSAGAKPRPTCAKAEFDCGRTIRTPTAGRRTRLPPRRRLARRPRRDARLLAAAKRAGHIQARRQGRVLGDRVQLRLEPADPKGSLRAARALGLRGALPDVANGVSVVMVPAARRAVPAEMYQSGLYFLARTASRATSRSLRCGVPLPVRRFQSAGGNGRLLGPDSVRYAEDRHRRAGGGAPGSPSRLGRSIATGSSPGASDGSRRQAPACDGSSSRSEAPLPFSLIGPADFRFCPWGSFC